MSTRIALFLSMLAVASCGKVVDNSGADARPGGNNDDGSTQPTCTDGEQNGDEEDVDCGGSNCAACVDCTVNTDCDSGLCLSGGSCATSRAEPCTDAAPTNATSTVVDVVTTYTPGSGWSTPADCAWSCNANYAQDGETCINERTVACVDAAPANATSVDAQVTITYTDAGGWTTADDCDWSCNADYAEENNACINSKQVACTPNNPANGMSVPANVTITYTDAGGWTTPALCDFTCNIDYCKVSNRCDYAYTELAFDNGSNLGSSWFGGDDRAGFNPRNVGGGQVFKTAGSINMDKFAFYYTGSFKNAANNASTVTLQLDFRNSSGTVLRSAQATVPSTFGGGWVWFDVANLTLSANTTYIATSWLINGYNLGVWSGIRSNTGSAYADGYRMTASRNDNGQMTAFSDWSGSATSTWDYWFTVRSPPACAQP